MTPSSRRHFLKSTIVGGIAAQGLFPSTRLLASESAAASGAVYQRVKNKAAISAGGDRVQNIVNALKPFAKEIKEAIGTKSIVIKPNNVATTNQLCATHADSMAGIIEFLKSLDLKNEIVIAESAADAPTIEGFENYGYTRLKDKYNVALIDLDKEPYRTLHVVDDGDFHPRFIRMAGRLLDPNTFRISAAVMKTHDRVVATLSLKNLVFGAPIKDEGFRWGPKSKPGAKTDKPITHGGGCKGINYNLFQLASSLHPHLSIIDGYQGMEGNGPVGGTPVDHKVAVAALDWFSADRTAVELMGIDFAYMGYLNYCAQAGMGEVDVAKIEQLGERIEGHRKKYKLHDRVDDQLIWKS